MDGGSNERTKDGGRIEFTQEVVLEACLEQNLYRAAKQKSFFTKLIGLGAYGLAVN